MNPIALLLDNITCQTEKLNVLAVYCLDKRHALSQRI